MRTVISIDKNSNEPIHRQIYDEWRRGILSARFRRGARLPSTRESAAALKVARSTVSQAYEQLLAEGYLQTQRGSGTFVCRELPEEMTHTQSASKMPLSKLKSKIAKPMRLSKFGAGLQDDFNPPAQLPGFIGFSRWGPDLHRFSFELWRKLVSQALRSSPQIALGYPNQSQGHETLRAEIAAYVARSRAVHCTAEQVVVVNGSQQALDFCARLLAEPGDEVAFENPGYLGTRRIFQAHQLRLKPARIDAEGIVPDDLKSSRLVYVTPSHQFPTGVSMSLKRRLELIAWARAHDAVIIEDDYDSEYRYTGPPLPSLQGLALDVPVVYCGTFSKVMFPGLRIGYAILPPQLVAPFTRAKWIADRNAPMLEQMALAEFLAAGHLERHIRRMRRLYGHRREVLVDALTKHFGERVQVCGDSAGMHLMIRITIAGDIYAHALQKKVQLGRTDPYYLTKPPANEFLLGFSTLGDRVIREGIKRIAS